MDPTGNPPADAHEWRKALALVMHKLGCTHVCITAEDMASFPAGYCLVVQEEPGELHLRIAPEGEARLLLEVAKAKQSPGPAG